MSKIKNGGLDQYGAKPFERQQFGTAGIEGVNGGHKTNDKTSENANLSCDYGYVLVTYTYI